MEKNYETETDIFVFIKTDFPSAFLLNGIFCEKADGFEYSAKAPLYVTVLPLEAHLLPYTVKLVNGKALSNEKLCASFMRGDKLMVKLFERYNYMYSATKNDERVGATIPERLFNAVKQKNYSNARKFLSEGLSSSVDDNGLDAFFDCYTAIVKDEFEKDILGNASKYYLITANSEGVAFKFDIKDGLVDNIVES